MGHGNAAVKQWLGKRERFADLFNGVIFDGEQIVLPEQLEPTDSEADILDVDKDGRTKEVRRHRDIVMKWKTKAELVMLACENQERVHYAMPVRNMLYDSLSYTEQIRQMWNEVPKDEKITSEEFLSKFRKSDKICPVVTIVLYYGKEPWDGSKELYEMFEDDFQGKDKLMRFIPNYRMNLIDVAHTEDAEKFQTDLQEVLGMLKYRNSKKELLNYINSKSGYFRHVDRDTYQVIRAFLNSEKMLKENVEMDKEETDMCQALQDLYDEGIEKGIEKGMVDLIVKKYRTGQSMEKIAEDLMEDLEKVKMVVSQI